MMNRDLRKVSRISCTFPALLRFPDAVPAESWGTIFDVGTDGMELETRSDLKEGAAVYVSFDVDDAHGFQNIKTKVLRAVRKNGYTLAGVEFDPTVDRVHLHEAMKAFIK